MPYVIRPDGKRVLCAWSPVELEYIEAASTLYGGAFKLACRDIAALTGRRYETIAYGAREIRQARARASKSFLEASLRKNWISESRSVTVSTPTMTRPFGNRYYSTAE